MGNRTSRSKGTTIALACLTVFGTVVIAGALIGITTEKGTAWAQDFRSSHAVYSQEVTVENTQKQNEQLKVQIERPQDILLDQIERSEQLLEDKANRPQEQIGMSESDGASVESQAENAPSDNWIEDHTLQSREHLDAYTEQTREFFENLFRKD